MGALMISTNGIAALAIATIVATVTPCVAVATTAATQAAGAGDEQDAILQALVARAEEQLAAGTVHQPQHDSALWTYRQVVRMAPNSDAARRLRERLRAALRERAQEALSRGVPAEASRLLELALEPLHGDAPPTGLVATTTNVVPATALSIAPAVTRMSSPAPLPLPAPPPALLAAPGVQPSPSSAAPDSVAGIAPAAGVVVPSDPPPAPDAAAVVHLPPVPVVARVAIAPPAASPSVAAAPASLPSASIPSPRIEAPHPVIAQARTPPAAPAAAPDAMIAMILKRGDDMLAAGDISAARLLYERAADSGNARAATGVGKTYDPNFLRDIGARGLTPDANRAAEWYRRAAEAGDAEAAQRLERLKTIRTR
jgi:hypothetical protein